MPRKSRKSSNKSASGSVKRSHGRKHRKGSKGTKNSRKGSKNTNKSLSQDAGSQVQNLYNQFMQLQAGGNAGGNSGGYPNMMALMQQMQQSQGGPGGMNGMNGMNAMAMNPGMGMGPGGMNAMAMNPAMMQAMMGAPGTFGGADAVPEYKPAGEAVKYIQITYYRRWGCENCKLFDTHYDRLTSQIGEQRDQYVAALVDAAGKINTTTGGTGDKDEKISKLMRIKDLPYVRSTIVEVFSPYDLPKGVDSVPAICMKVIDPDETDDNKKVSKIYHYEDIYNRSNAMYGKLMLYDQVFNYMWKDMYYPMVGETFPDMMNFMPFYFLG